MAGNDAITKADIEGLKLYIDGRISGVERSISEVRTELRTEIRVNAAKIDGVKDSMNWHFTTLAIVVAIVGFTITLAPMFREIFREKHRERRDDEIRSMIRDEFAKLRGNPEH